MGQTEEAKKKQEALEALEASEKTEQQKQISLLTQQVLELSSTAKTKSDEEAATKLQEQETLLATASDIRALMNDDDETAASANKGAEDLTNKELLDVVAKAFDTAVDAKMHKVTQDINTNISKIEKNSDDVKGAVTQIIAALGVQAAQSQFSDFDSYRDEVSKVMGMYPGIDIGHAYVLAKGLKSMGSPTQKVAESERPTGEGAPHLQVARSRKSNQEDKASTHGIVGFRGFLNDAIDKVVVDR